MDVLVPRKRYARNGMLRRRGAIGKGISVVRGTSSAKHVGR